MAANEFRLGKTRSFLKAREPSIDLRFRPRPESKVKLFHDIQEEEKENTTTNCSVNKQQEDESSEPASFTGETEGVLVHLRLRPVESSSLAYSISDSTLITRRVTPGDYNPITLNNKNSIEKHYSFSSIFDSEVAQHEIYEKCIRQGIESDESFVIMTYGTSGSGKTFTLLGDDQNPGIIPRSLENIFTLYKKNIYPQPSMKSVNSNVTILDDEALKREIQIRHQLLDACDAVDIDYSSLQNLICSEHNFIPQDLKCASVLIWISFVEIYNEVIYDLLSVTPTTAPSYQNGGQRSANLKIIGNDGKVFVKGLTKVYVKNSLEALELLYYGLRRVNYASTSINANSSRSHCIFVIDVIKYFKSGLTTETMYKFCDLAGSERLHKTGNVGFRLKEAQCINTSLMILGRCLDAANSNRKKSNELIPYRESKLTMLLQAALLGKEKMTMVVNVTPTDKYFEENVNVLGFASIAKNIVFKEPVAKRKNSCYSLFLEHSKTSTLGGNIEGNDNTAQLLEEIERLREEVAYLKNELNNSKIQHEVEMLRQEHELRNELVDSFMLTINQNKRQYEERLEQDALIRERTLQSKISSLKRKHELEIEDLREELEAYKNRKEADRRNTLD